MKYVGYTIAWVLILDFFGFGWWALSGQKPVDNFFLGTITYHLINLVS